MFFRPWRQRESAEMEKLESDFRSVIGDGRVPLARLVNKKALETTPLMHPSYHQPASFPHCCPSPKWESICLRKAGKTWLVTNPLWFMCGPLFVGSLYLLKMGGHKGMLQFVIEPLLNPSNSGMFSMILKQQSIKYYQSKLLAQNEKKSLYISR